MRYLIPIVAIGGCASNAPPVPPPWTSGSAVQATLYQGPDGFETLAGAYDTILGSGCPYDVGMTSLVGCNPVFTESMHHMYKAVGYEALETADGFSIITRLDAPDSGPAGEGSGRLQNLFEPQGEVRRFAGIYDTMLARYCRPYADSGVTYCLPTADQVTLGNGWTDSNCLGTATVLYTPTRAIYVSGRPFTVMLCDTQATIYVPVPQTHCGTTTGYVCHSIVEQLAQLTLH